MQFSIVLSAIAMASLSVAYPNGSPPPSCSNSQVASCCKNSAILPIILGQSCSLLSVISDCQEQDVKCCSANNNGGIAVQLPCVDVL